MNTITRYFCITILFIYSAGIKANAQTKAKDVNDNLFSAGYAAGFIGGLYDAFYPYKKLLQHGDFGLGAPEKLDGELIVLHGKMYQTQFTGKTTPMSDTGKTAYAV
ncbi:MAG: alpha-acetolactate decarboxylase, partial [Mucilaginibacter sp.]|nr:alpha-acetolactate decarboxylase [Mucilaginibacter sp.]